MATLLLKIPNLLLGNLKYRSEHLCTLQWIVNFTDTNISWKLPAFTRQGKTTTGLPPAAQTINELFFVTDFHSALKQSNWLVTQLSYEKYLSPQPKTQKCSPCFPFALRCGLTSLLRQCPPTKQPNTSTKCCSTDICRSLQASEIIKKQGLWFRRCMRFN